MIQFVSNMKHSNFDAPENIGIHKRTIYRKKFLHLYYYDIYNEILNIIKGKKTIIELGSGGGFLKDIVKNVITSDVVPGPGIDRVFSACDIPFPDKSVDAFALFSVLHHIKNAEKALAEMSRCLKKGGEIIMIEPNNSPLSSFIFKNFHYEDFDVKATWRVNGNRRLSDANLALPWIIFRRDVDIFTKKYPEFAIIEYRAHTAFRYMFSGGITYNWTTPSIFYPLIKEVDNLVSPFNKYLGMFVTIRVKKIK